MELPSTLYSFSLAVACPMVAVQTDLDGKFMLFSEKPQVYISENLPCMCTVRVGEQYLEYCDRGRLRCNEHILLTL